MTILINRKTRQPLVINTDHELTAEIKKISKYFKQINDLNRHLFASLHLEPINSPSIFYDTLKELLGSKGSGTRVNKEKLVANYGWTVADAEEWDRLFRTRTDRHLEKTGKDGKMFHQQNSQFTEAFWIKRGFTQEEAKENISRVQAGMSAKTTPEGRKLANPLSLDYKKYDSLSLEEKKEKINNLQCIRSVRRIEYWLKRGFTEEQSREFIRDIQRKWMENKTEEELAEINKKKGESVLNYNTLWTDKYDIPGILYLIEIQTGLFKIGITSKEVVAGKNGRYALKDVENAKIHLELKLEKITSAFCIEQLILRLFKDKRVIRNYGPFGKFEVMKHDAESIMQQISLLIPHSPEILKEKLFSLINKNK